MVVLFLQLASRRVTEFTASTREPPILLPEKTSGMPIFSELSCGGTRCMLVDCVQGVLTQFVTQGDCLRFALRLIEEQPELQVRFSVLLVRLPVCIVFG